MLDNSDDVVIHVPNFHVFPEKRNKFTSVVDPNTDPEPEIRPNLAPVQSFYTELHNQF